MYEIKNTGYISISFLSVSTSNTSSKLTLRGWEDWASGVVLLFNPLSVRHTVLLDGGVHILFDEELTTTCTSPE